MCRIPQAAPTGRTQPSLLPRGLGLRLLRGLGDLALPALFLVDPLDHPNGNRLPHITHREPPQRRVLGEGLENTEQRGISFKSHSKTITHIMGGL